MLGSHGLGRGPLPGMHGHGPIHATHQQHMRPGTHNAAIGQAGHAVHAVNGVFGLHQQQRVALSHLGGVTALCFSPDGAVLASGSADGKAVLWCSASLRPLARLHGHMGRIHALSFNPRSTLLASAGDDCSLRLWRVPGGEQQAHMRFNLFGFTCACFCTSGSALATGAEDGRVLVWQAVTLKEIAYVKGHTAPVTSITFHPGHTTWFASVAEDAFTGIQVWDYATGQQLASFGYRNVVYCSLAFSPCWNALAAAALQLRDAQVWRLQVVQAGPGPDLDLSRQGSKAMLSQQVSCLSAPTSPALLRQRSKVNSLSVAGKGGLSSYHSCISSNQAMDGYTLSRHSSHTVSPHPDGSPPAVTLEQRQSVDGSPHAATSATGAAGLGLAHEVTQQGAEEAAQEEEVDEQPLVVLGCEELEGHGREVYPVAFSPVVQGLLNWSSRDTSSGSGVGGSSSSSGGEDGDGAVQAVEGMSKVACLSTCSADGCARLWEVWP